MTMNVVLTRGLMTAYLTRTTSFIKLNTYFERREAHLMFLSVLSKNRPRMLTARTLNASYYI